jgi:hypothetical protein
VVDALADYGVKHIEMPVTPERVWRAIHVGGAPAHDTRGFAASGSTAMSDKMSAV